MRFLALLMCLALAMLGFAACGGSEGPSDVEKNVPPDITLLQAIDFDNVKMVQRHMDYGTDPNEVFIPEGYPFAGASALHQAVLKNNAEIVRLLLGNGADIEMRAMDEFKGRLSFGPRIGAFMTWRSCCWMKGRTSTHRIPTGVRHWMPPA